MKVNIKYLPLKLHYFVVFAGVAPVLPFLPLYSRQLGISTTALGVVYTVLPFIGLLSKSIFGYLADLFKIHRIVFLSSIAICALGFFCVYFCRPIPENSNPDQAKVEFHCSSTSYLVYCSEQEKCAKGNALNEITTNVTTLCEASCPVATSVCSNIPGCNQGQLNFTTVTNLYHRDKEKLCTYFPLSNLTVGSKEVMQPYCTDLHKCNCSVVCNNNNMMTYLGAPLTIPLKNVQEFLSYYQFWLYFCCVIIAWCGLSTLVVMSDTITFQVLDSESYKYGQQRLFGAIGWSLLVVITGAIIDYVSHDQLEKDYTPAFILCVCILFVDLFIASRMPVQLSTKEESPDFLSIIHLLFKPHVFLFIICCIIVGISTGVLWTFLLILVRDVAFKWDCHFEALSLLQGLMMGIQSLLGEVPFFFFSGYIIKKLGHPHTLSLIIAVFGIRFVIYSSVSNPWAFLPIELLNGLTFGLFYALMTSYAHIIAPSGMAATMQGIVGACFEGIGIGIGGFAGGYLYFTAGGSMAFLYFGIFNIVFSLIHFILQVLLAKFSYGENNIPVGYVQPGDHEDGAFEAFANGNVRNNEAEAFAY